MYALAFEWFWEYLTGKEFVCYQGSLIRQLLPLGVHRKPYCPLGLCTDVSYGELYTIRNDQKRDNNVKPQVNALEGGR